MITFGVYPHARGETSCARVSWCVMRGLSPRTWGNQVVVCDLAHGRGSIPTHVGKPLCVALLVLAGGVYPHARGETLGPSLPAPSLLGLSPRTWGNLALASVGSLQLGSIPTHVGKPDRPDGGGRL